MDPFSPATLKFHKIAKIKLNPLYFYSEINPVYYFYWKMNIFTFAQICGGFFIIVSKFFLLFITSSISLLYKTKTNLAVLFRHKNPENQYMRVNTCGSFNFVCLQYSSSVRKTHSPSPRASLPTTRTANSILGLKRPTLRHRYTIYYYTFQLEN